MLLVCAMKALPKILLALTAVAALSVAYPAKANLITNPGFETGDFTGWTQWGMPGSVGGWFPHSGNFEAVLSGGGFTSHLTQSVATTPGATYTIDFFAAFSHGGTPSNFNVKWGGLGIFGHLFTTSSPYTEYTFNVTALSSSTSLDFSINEFGFLLLDDVSVTPAGVPDAGSTLPLLGFASLGLVALRRKLGC
jgi:hypothetical protein